MTYIIAEVGGNHDGNLKSALDHVRAAKDSGANAVKFQIYQADKLVTASVKAFRQAKGYRYQIDRFKDLELTEQEWELVIDECYKYQIDFMATCFDIESLAKYEPYMKYLKIASGDITYKALIEAAGKYNKQVIVSTGMANFDEIQEASKWIPQHLLTVLHCVSCYPCPDSGVDFNQMNKLKQFYKRVGYSDHAMGITACLAAAALGATMIEKHFSLDNTKDYGDHPHSASPQQLKELVSHAQRINKMFSHNDCEQETQRFRRGGYAAHDMAAGDVITERDILCLRPANSFPPHAYVGMTLEKDLNKGEPLDG